MAAGHGATAAVSGRCFRCSGRGVRRSLCAEHPRFPRHQMLIYSGRCLSRPDYRERYSRRVRPGALCGTPYRRPHRPSESGPICGFRWTTSTAPEAYPFCSRMASRTACHQGMVVEITCPRSRTPSTIAQTGVMHRFVHPSTSRQHLAPTDDELRWWVWATPAPRDTTTLTRANVMLGSLSFASPGQL